ncbi:hypothetical protein V6C32_07540 [Desulforamulus ruminis]|uniref:hypothetical protein n=1 Tax=Desulforamulus ruminis TaxID=1564 RepID=UPI002FD96F80
MIKNKEAQQPRKKVYSEIIELTPWDFCDDSLLPGPILVHSCNMKMRLFAHYYWNIFNRVEDKRITYEIPLVNLHILDKPIHFLDERRLLFQTSVQSIFDGSMIQVETGIFKARAPFEQVAYCNWHGMECWHNDPNHWVLGEFKEVPGITPELSQLLPEAEESSVENIRTVMNRISAAGDWSKPVETTHKMLHSQCEYGYMGAFMNYVGPLISMGKDALLKGLAVNGPKPYPASLAQKLDYRNWRLWVSIKKAFYFDEEISMKSSYLAWGSRHYIKHELYSLKPAILRNIFLEEYVLE